MKFKTTINWKLYALFLVIMFITYMIDVTFTLTISTVSNLIVTWMFVSGLIVCFMGYMQEQVLRNVIAENIRNRQLDASIVSNQLVGKRFKTRSSDNVFSDWEDTIIEVKFSNHKLFLAGVHKDDESYSSPGLIVKGTRNEFGYTLDEIVLLN